MTREIKIFAWGFAISFSGSLPLGTLNVSVTNLAVNNGLLAAFEFALAAIFVEVVMVRIALAVMNQLEKLTLFFRLFNWLSFLLVLSLGIASLVAAFEMKKFQASIPLTQHHPFLAGFCLSLLNPLHLPFWMGWSAALKAKNVLTPSKKSYNVYVTAIGLGTFFAFEMYAFAGRLVINILKEQQQVLNWIVGATLLITALLQFDMLVKKKRTFFQIKR